MTGWDGWTTIGEKIVDETTEFDRISTHIVSAKKTNEVSKKHADPNQGLGDNVRVEVVQNIIDDISTKIEKASYEGKFAITFSLSFCLVPMVRPYPSTEELNVVMDILKNRGYETNLVNGSLCRYLDINWIWNPGNLTKENENE